MKIKIDATCIANTEKGAGRYAYNLIEALHKIDNYNKYTILVNKNLITTNKIFDLQNSRWSIKKTDINPTGFLRQLKYLKPYENADLFHCLNAHLPILHIGKSIVTIHDLTFIKVPDYFSHYSKIKTFLFKSFLKLVATKATRIITVSENTKKDIVKFLNINPKKIIPIYEGVTSKFPIFNINEDIVLKKNKIKKPYFVYIGIQRPHKNLVRLTKAFIQFKKKHKIGINLVFVGKKAGKKYPEFTNLLKELSRNDIILTGYVNDEELAVLLKNSLALTFPSLYEGFGLPILEAMASGTPVITSNKSALIEVAGDAALYVDPFDIKSISEAMACVAFSEEKRNELIQKGLKRVKSYSWEKTAKETLKVYEETLK